MRHLNAPEHWVVELQDGSRVHVWAPMRQKGWPGKDDRMDFRFVNLMDIEQDDQAWFDVQGRTPSNPARVIGTVAHFPRTAVQQVLGP